MKVITVAKVRSNDVDCSLAIFPPIIFKHDLRIAINFNESESTIKVMDIRTVSKLEFEYIVFGT